MFWITNRAMMFSKAFLEKLKKIALTPPIVYQLRDRSQPERKDKLQPVRKDKDQSIRISYGYPGITVRNIEDGVLVVIGPCDEIPFRLDNRISKPDVR